MAEQQTVNGVGTSWFRQPGTNERNRVLTHTIDFLHSVNCRNLEVPTPFPNRLVRKFKMHSVLAGKTRTPEPALGMEESIDTNEAVLTLAVASWIDFPSERQIDSSPPRVV